MSVQFITSDLIMELSTQEQQVLTGGQVSTPPGGQMSPNSFQDNSEVSPNQDTSTSSCSDSHRRRFPSGF